MRFLGVILALGGWALAVGGLFWSQTNMGRGLFAVAGIVVTLLGVFKAINGYYVKNAIWKQ